MAAVRIVPTGAPSSLERLVEDYLTQCRARGLSRRTIDNAYGYSLRAVLLPWCQEQGITAVE